MPKFTAAVQLTNPATNAREGFLPGDTVPAWALNRVGSHVHDGEDVAGGAGDSEIVDSADVQAAEIIARAENDAAGIVAKAEVEAEAILAAARAKTESPAEDGTGDAQGDANAEVEESGEPDFTKPAGAAPAPAKRGRPRKQG